MPSRPRTAARSLSYLVACGATAAALVLAGCGSDAADGVGDPSEDTSSAVQANEVVTLQLDVAAADDSQMEQVAQVVRRRLEALGVERSDIGWDGTTLDVLVPGGDEELLRRALQGTGALEFRPVLQVIDVVPGAESSAATQARVEELRAQLEIPDGVTAAQIAEEEQAREQSSAGAQGDRDDGGEAATPALNRWGVDVYVPEFAELYRLELTSSTELTPPSELTADAEVTLSGADGTVYVLGPVALDGSAIESAAAELQANGQWMVSPRLAQGQDGIDRLNAIAAQCHGGQPTCPDLGNGSGRLGIVVDGAVLSAPTIHQASFEADQISISGSYDERGAQALAAALDAGAAPVAWTLRD